MTSGPLRDLEPWMSGAPGGPVSSAHVARALGAFPATAFPAARAETRTVLYQPPAGTIAAGTSVKIDEFEVPAGQYALLMLIAVARADPAAGVFSSNQAPTLAFVAPGSSSFNSTDGAVWNDTTNATMSPFFLTDNVGEGTVDVSLNYSQELTTVAAPGAVWVVYQYQIFSSSLEPSF